MPRRFKYAGCIQSDGEPDFPHPGGQGLVQVKNATVILDPNSPQYLQAAQTPPRARSGS